MKRLFFLLCLLVGFAGNANESRQRHAISYQGGARFGDRMLVYAQARYLSYVTSVPFLYRPFIYSDQVTIDCEAALFDQYRGNYSRTLIVNSLSTLVDLFRLIEDPQTAPTLFIVDYFPSDITEWDRDASNQLLLNIPWRDPAFHTYLQKVASPRIPIPNFRKEAVLNVADHVRMLSGEDTEDTSVATLPLKHPNLIYHKNQIRRIYHLNKQRPMHVFIFSDTKDPEGLIKEFRRTFATLNIEFGIQILKNSDTEYAVHDFFAMQKFDALIATQSNFSMMASRIGSFDMVIFPIHIQGKYPRTQVDRIQLISHKSSWFPYDINITVREDVKYE